MLRRIVHAMLLTAISSGPAHAKGPARAAPLFSTPVEACIVPAARFHSVNEYVLRSILKVESGLNPSTTVSRNKNGTVDVGICQFNSMHFKRLATHNVAPADLLDPCICTYVAAWHLSQFMASNGNTWEGIARYHSATPYFNRRYQILLSNELVRIGALLADIKPVPPLEPGAMPRTAMRSRPSANQLR